MIKAQEIRIGNKLRRIDNGLTVEVEAIGNDGVNITWGGRYLQYNRTEPIPLTPELFEKCGFTYDSKEDENGISYWDIVCGERLFSIGVIEGRFFFVDIMMPDKRYLTKMEYLHQLQNLYYVITGEELKIN